MRATFKKSERLCGKKLLESTHRNGLAVKSFPFILLYKQCEFEEPVAAKLAISIPRKRVKLAVKRNAIKRRIRESYRVNKAPLYDLLEQQEKQLAMLLIFVGRDENMDSNLVKKKISGLLARLCKEIAGDNQEEVI